MTRLLRYSFYLLFTWLVLFLSCRKEYSCEKCHENKPPIANAGSDAKLLLPLDSLTLDGTASSDRDGKIIAWEWTKIAGPASVTISFPKAAQTRVKHLVRGQYQFELKVTDDGGLSSRDTLRITVDSASGNGSSPQGNRPPVANAGPDQNVLLPSNHTILNGSASSDPDSNIVSYRWVKIAGPSSFTLVNANSMVMEVKDLVQGTYSFELLVTDAGGSFSRDTVQVFANFLSGNIPPVADAGADQKRILRSTRVPLDGSGSHDPDGIIMGSTWSQIKGPNIAQITHVNLPVSSIVGFVEGVYIFRLEVTDDKGAKDDDTVMIEFVRDTLSGKTIIYDDIWGCNDVCQDGDVYWTPQPDPADPMRYFDPNVPLEVSIMLDTSTVWIPVLHRDSNQPRINQFFYYIERDLLWVFAWDAKLIGRRLTIRVKFL
ncbi:MAG TPA: PKD domain-containing protein [Flavitalea sp.]|nr:PKD domain-containing protein [Flavitalea sp.]